MFRKICTYILVFIFLEEIKSNLLPDENLNHHFELAEFAAKIFLNECKLCDLTTIIFTRNDLTADAFFNRLSTDSYNMPIFTVQLENFTLDTDIEYPNDLSDLTVIFLSEENYANADAVIFGIELAPFWNIRGKFLIVSADVPTDDEDEWIQNSFGAFWEKQALRVLIAFWRDGLKLFSYNPFLENFGYDVTNRSDLSEIFAHRIRNMHGYPIKMYHIDAILKGRAELTEKDGKKIWIGFDGMYMAAVANALNASLVVRRVSDDFDEDMYKNADLEAPFQQIMDFFSDVYDFDVLMNAVRAYTDNDMDKMFLYQRDDLFIAVPRGKRISPFLLVFQLIQYDVLFASIFSLIAVSLAMMLVRKCGSQKMDVSNAFLDNYRILLTESPPDRQRQQQERLLFVIWVLHCIVFATLFQTMFMSSLVVPKYYPNIDTYDELDKAQMKVYASEYLRIQIVKGMHGENKKFVQLLTSVPKAITPYGESLDWITYYRQENGIVLSQGQIYELMVRDKAAQDAYHIMKESAMPNAFCYCIRKQKLYYDEILQILWRIQDAGLHIHWRDFNYYMEKNRLNSSESVSDLDGTGENQILGMAHLRSTFMLLLSGYAVALAAFFCEFVCRRKHKRNGTIK